MNIPLADTRILATPVYNIIGPFPPGFRTFFTANLWNRWDEDIIVYGLSGYFLYTQPPAPLMDDRQGQLQITEQNGDTWFNRPATWRNVVGNILPVAGADNRPLWLPIPKIVPAQSSLIIQCDFSNGIWPGGSWTAQLVLVSGEYWKSMWQKFLAKGN